MRSSFQKFLGIILAVVLVTFPMLSMAEQLSGSQDTIDKYIDWDLWVEMSSLNRARLKIIVNDDSSQVYEYGCEPISLNVNDLITILSFPCRTCSEICYFWDDAKEYNYVQSYYTPIYVPQDFEVGSTHKLTTWMYYNRERNIWSHRYEFTVNIVGVNENPMKLDEVKCHALVQNDLYDNLIADESTDSIWLSDYLLLEVNPIEGKEYSRLYYKWSTNRDMTLLNEGRYSADNTYYIDNLSHLTANGKKYDVTLSIFVELADGTIVPQGEKDVVFTYDFRYYALTASE